MKVRRLVRAAIDAQQRVALPACLACAIAAAPAAAGPWCQPTWTLEDLHGGAGASLYGSFAVDRDDVWAVGSRYDGASDAAIAVHWDGSTWRDTAMPRFGRAAYLTSVAAVAAGDVWTVGSRYDDAGMTGTLAAHWDGIRWSAVATPSPGAIASYLASVTALAADDVWAVGYQVTSAARYETLALHWDGSSWRVVPTPNPGAGDNLIDAVAASAHDDVWSAGFFDSGGGATQTLVMRWDGSAWNEVASPNPGLAANALYGVHVRARDDAWVVGTWHDGHDNVSLTARWDGAEWSVVPSPNIAQSGNVLNDVHGASRGDVWAVGYYYNTVGDRVQETLTLHWDGDAWSLVPSPNASHDSAFSYLEGVASSPNGEAWAVGLSPAGAIVERLCAIEILDAGFAPATATVAHGSAATWLVPASDELGHAVADATGMTLFDSGIRAPGESFSYRFIAAGRYAVRDSVDASSGSIRVPVRVVPAAGGVQTGFVVEWAAEPAPAGFVYDVQLRRPAGGPFTAWHMGATGPGARFVPDAGTGAYAFRSRLRRLDGGARSAWSAPAQIDVS